MALETQQTVALSGTSKINGQTVANFSANIPQNDGNSNISLNIQSQVLYDANRKEVRADQAAFQAKVYEIEGNLLAQETTTE